MEQLTRFPDWAKRLNSYVSSVRSMPFNYGTLDCALFCADAVLAMTGRDLASGMRGYTSYRDGLRIVRSLGFTDHIDVYRQSLPEIAPSHAQDGDVGVIASGLCIVASPVAVFGFSEHGLGLFQRTNLITTFKV